MCSTGETSSSSARLVALVTCAPLLGTLGHTALQLVQRLVDGAFVPRPRTRPWVQTWLLGIFMLFIVSVDCSPGPGPPCSDFHDQEQANNMETVTAILAELAARERDGRGKGGLGRIGPCECRGGDNAGPQPTVASDADAAVVELVLRVLKSTTHDKHTLRVRIAQTVASLAASSTSVGVHINLGAMCDTKVADNTNQSRPTHHDTEQLLQFRIERGSPQYLALLAGEKSPVWTDETRVPGSCIRLFWRSRSAAVTAAGFKRREDPSPPSEQRKRGRFPGG